MALASMLGSGMFEAAPYIYTDNQPRPGSAQRGTRMRGGEGAPVQGVPARHHESDIVQLADSLKLNSITLIVPCSGLLHRGRSSLL